MDAKSLYMKELANHDLLTREEELRLLKTYHESEDSSEVAKALDTLVRCNQAMVMKIAKKYISYGVPYMDLIQFGNEGLMNGIRKFDASRGCRLLTIACWYIELSITDKALDETSQFAIKRAQRNEIIKLKKLMRGGKSLEEAAKQMKLSLGRANKLLSSNQEVVEYDSHDDGYEWIDGRFNQRGFRSVEDDVHRAMYLDQVQSTILEIIGSTKLGKTERLVIRNMYGILGGRELNPSELSSAYGKTRSNYTYSNRGMLSKLKRKHYRELSALHSLA